MQLYAELDRRKAVIFIHPPSQFGRAMWPE